jgi:hypothetical protein
VALFVFFARATWAWVVASDLVSGAALGCLLGSVASGHAGLVEFAFFLALKLGFDLIDGGGGLPGGNRYRRPPRFRRPFGDCYVFTRLRN